MQDVMIDIETLDTRPSAVMLSIAAVRFDLEHVGMFASPLHIHIDIDSSLAAGRTVSGSTLLWWLDQDEPARRKILDADRVPLHRALLQVSEYITEKDRVWGNGANFDNAILTDAFRSCGLPQPWRYWGDMCYRTMKNLHPQILRPAFEGVKHDALADATNQAWHLQEIYQYLRRNPPTTVQVA